MGLHRKRGLLALLVAPALLSACSPATGPNLPDQHEAAVPAEQVFYTTTTETSPYGYVTPSKGSVAAGDEVTYTVTSYDSLYSPYGVRINGETFQLGDDDSYTATMAEGGNDVTPLFQIDLADLKITADYYRIEIEQLDGASYNIDTGRGDEASQKWQSSGVFDQNVIPHLEYTVNIKYPGDGNTLVASEDYSTTVMTVPGRAAALETIEATDMALEGELKIQGTYLGQNQGSSAVFKTQSALTDDRYVMNLTYGDTTLSEAYYRGPGDKVVIKMIDRFNQVNIVPNEELTFSTTFVDPFTQVTNDEVYLSSDGSRLYIDMGQVKPSIVQTIPVLISAQTMDAVTDLYVTLDKNYNPTGIHYEGYYYSGDTIGVKYYCTYDGTYVDPDEVPELSDIEPYETLPEHARLQALFDALKNQNYTAHSTTESVSAEGASTTAEAEITVADNGILVENATEKKGRYQDGDNYYVYTVRTDESGEEYMGYDSGIYPIVSSQTGGLSISFYTGTFDFAPEVFEVKEDGSFQLRNYVNFYNYADNVLPDCVNPESMALYIDDGSLNIAVDDSDPTDLKAVFTYTFTDPSTQATGKVTVEVEDIGSTVFPYTAEDLKPSASE